LTSLSPIVMPGHDAKSVPARAHREATAKPHYLTDDAALRQGILPDLQVAQQAVAPGGTHAWRPRFCEAFSLAPNPFLGFNLNKIG